jgi:Uma2 family endonuclease
MIERSSACAGTTSSRAGDSLSYLALIASGRYVEIRGPTGAVAQLGERRVRNAEVEGSIPFRSIGVPSGFNGAAGMSTIVPSQSLPLMAPLASPVVYRMTVDEFERIADSLDDDHVELLDGYIVGRDDMKPPHVLVTERLRRRLDRIVPGGWFVREEKPVRIPDYDEPRPDISIVKGDPEAYATRHPEPADVGLLIEVSQSSLDRDQGRKQVIYGGAGIHVYWVVNLVDRRIEVYTDPNAAGYASRVDLVAGQDVPVVIGGAQVGRIPVDAIQP